MASSDSESLENPPPVFGVDWDYDDIDSHGMYHHPPAHNISPNRPLESPPSDPESDISDGHVSGETETYLPGDPIPYLPGETSTPISTYPFVVKLTRDIIEKGSVRIPDPFYFVGWNTRIVNFDNAELHCPSTGNQLQCTLQKNLDVFQVSIDGNYQWFMNVNGWNFGDSVKFVKRNDEDRVVFDVDRVAT